MVSTCCWKAKPDGCMLSREEYEQLEKKAKSPPRRTLRKRRSLVSADYLVTVEPQRARLSGKLVIDVLEGGLHAVPLDLSDVGLRALGVGRQARRDRQPSALSPSRSAFDPQSAARVARPLRGLRRRQRPA